MPGKWRVIVYFLLLIVIWVGGTIWVNGQAVRGAARAVFVVGQLLASSAVASQIYAEKR